MGLIHGFSEKNWQRFRNAQIRNRMAKTKATSKVVAASEATQKKAPVLPECSDSHVLTDITTDDEIPPPPPLMDDGSSKVKAAEEEAAAKAKQATAEEEAAAKAKQATAEEGGSRPTSSKKKRKAVDEGYLLGCDLFSDELPPAPKSTSYSMKDIPGTKKFRNVCHKIIEETRAIVIAELQKKDGDPWILGRDAFNTLIECKAKIDQGIRFG